MEKPRRPKPTDRQGGEQPLSFDPMTPAAPVDVHGFSRRAPHELWSTNGPIGAALRRGRELEADDDRQGESRRRCTSRRRIGAKRAGDQPFPQSSVAIGEHIVSACVRSASM